MYRLGVGHESLAASGSQDRKLHHEQSQQQPLLAHDLDEYMQTSGAHMPTLVVLRLLGLLPSCLRRPVAQQIGVEKEVSGCCHKMAHFFLWIYAILVWIILLTTGLWALAFLIGATKTEVQTPIVYWMLFDLFGLWQTIFLTGTFMLKGTTYGWLMSSFDFFTASFNGIFLTRSDLSMEAVLIQEKQAGMGPTEGELVGEKSPGSGNQVHPLLSVQQQLSELDGDRSESRRSMIGKDEEPEEVEFSEVYIRKSRIWDFLLLVLILLVLLGVLAFVIYARVTSYILTDKKVMPPLVYPHMLKWTLTMMNVDLEDMYVISVGLLLECLATLYQVLPSVLFVMLLTSYSHLANEFNERLRLARDEGFLDIDATITYHYRLKTLAKRMGKSFGSVIFWTIFGDLVIIASASYLGFTRVCKLKDGDGLCISYLARHMLVLVRLIVIVLTGATIQDKLNYSISQMDGYMCKSILNTERLKILGMISQSNSCCFSASGFFNLTKPFAMAILTLVVTYMAVMYRLG